MTYSPPSLLLIFLTGTALGALLSWLVLRIRVSTQAQITDTFKALAADTLNQNSAAFLQLAETKLREREQAAAENLDKKSTAIDHLIKPVQESLKQMDEQLRALEIKREGAYRELAQLVTNSQETQVQLRNETGQLLQALRAPTSRGQWGELQLKRLLEMTGMSQHTQDFSTQTTFAGDDNNIRPDFIVSLPGERCVIIDSKVPLTAYLDSVQTNEETTRSNALKQHARHVKNHIKTLSSKSYWEKVEGTPEFVVLFLPGEHFLSAALDADPSLMEYSAQNNIVIATPMTLVALLRTVAYGWRQEALNENIREVTDMGRKLYGALSTFTSHLDTLGSRLGSTVEMYNKAVGSLERNVMVKVRRLAEIGIGNEEAELSAPAPIEKEPRLVVIQQKEEEEQEKPLLCAK